MLLSERLTAGDAGQTKMHVGAGPSWNIARFPQARLAARSDARLLLISGTFHLLFPGPGLTVGNCNCRKQNHGFEEATP